MTLILKLRNPEAGSDVAPEFELSTGSAILGRSKNCDWTLPDPSNTISSRHAEVRRDGGAFILKDISTNGTFLNGDAQRLAGEHVLKEGDSVRIGGYELVATVVADAPPPPPPEPKPEQARPAPDRDATIVAGSPLPAEEAPPENVTVMWDSLADINKVDWARGGLGTRDQGEAIPEGQAIATDQLVAAFAEAAALDPDVARSPELVRKAGSLLRRLVSGLVVMVEARARAKAQMGAEATGLELEGNNPIKFARSPEQALARLLSQAEPGFMEADRAVEDAFLDLQSHQVATLRAIPGALRATLDRFSPGSIRRRAEAGGILSRILPALQDAALWRNYEREYVKVKNESDEAFMEVFSREFRKAYERQLREGLDGKDR